MTLNFRIIWIKIAASALLIIPGVMMILAPLVPMFFVAVSAFLDFAFQPLNGLETLSGTTAGLLNAILGGVLLGFGVMIWMVAEHVYRKDVKLGRRLLLAPIVSWFLCDSLGSVIAGAWFNAALNVGIFVLLTIPVLWPNRFAK